MWHDRWDATDCFLPQPVNAEGFTAMDRNQVILANEQADLLRRQHQLVVELDNAAEQDKGIFREFLYFRWLSLAFDLGDGEVVTAQRPDFLAHGSRQMAL